MIGTYGSSGMNSYLPRLGDHIYDWVVTAINVNYFIWMKYKARC